MAWLPHIVFLLCTFWELTEPGSDLSSDLNQVSFTIFAIWTYSSIVLCTTFFHRVEISTAESRWCEYAWYEFFGKVGCVQSHAFLAWYCTYGTKELTVNCTNGSQHVKSQCRLKKKFELHNKCVHCTANTITEETAVCFLSLSESMLGDRSAKRTHSVREMQAQVGSMYNQLCILCACLVDF